MSGVYALLGFPTTDPIANSGVENLSTKVQVQMSMMPPLLTDWQQADLISNEVENYFQNPCANSTQIIWNTANTVSGIDFANVTFTNTNISNLVSYITIQVSNISQNIANAFLIHTNRMSNVTPMDVDVEKPHYETAIGYGKMMMYITNQTDNIQNNSPIMGNFTSILFANTLNVYANSFQSNSQIFLSSIGVGPPYTSNLTLVQAQSWANSVNSAVLMENYRQQDNTFFQNSKIVLDRYNKVSQFNKIGQTELYLMNTFIGSEGLKANLANTTANT